MTRFLPILLLSLLAGCATFRDDGGIRGGSPEEQSAFRHYFRTEAAWLREQGFTRVQDTHDRRGYRLIPQPNVGVVTLRSGNRQGKLKQVNAHHHWYALASVHACRYARPLSPEVVQHEVRHPLLEWAGYIEESRSHDRRAFPDGGNVR